MDQCEDGSLPIRSASKAELRRARLIATASKLFSEHGFHNTGIAQIARESGVMVGQIYRDFASKEDIVAAIVERDLQEFLSDDPLRRAALAGDRAAMRAWIARFIHGKDDKDYVLILDIIAESSRNARIAAIVKAIRCRIRSSIDDALAMLAPGEDKASRRRLLTEVIMTISVGIFHTRIENCGAVDRDSVAAIIRAVDGEIDALIAAP